MNLPPITLTLFGGVTIKQGETAVTGFASRKVEALLIYLAYNPSPHPRESLATLLWPNNEQNRALANLSVALSSIRKLLPDALVAERHTVAINSEATLTVDALAFQTALDQAKMAQQKQGKLGRFGAALLASAVDLYSGDFLAGFNIRNSIPFEDWMLLEQERLRHLYLSALADLTTFHQQRHQHKQAITYAQKLLATDPLQEQIHRQLMTLYALANQRHAAIAQYEQCVRTLADELDIEPDEETTALFEEISAGQLKQQATEALVAARHNLPNAKTPFVGRKAELEQIAAWLVQSKGRLLSITGPGGSGKTRLAHEAAHDAVGRFADGVWTVSLVAQSEVSGAFTAIAEGVGLTLSGKENLEQQLLNHLSGQELLLILDNMEHLLGPPLLDFIAALLARAPDLFLIVTSRERLRLQAETVLDLDGLPYPTEGTNPASDPNQPSPILHYPAVALFLDRATRIQPRFSLNGQETAVGQLCQIVGGLPLALELAATWTRILSVDDIVAEIAKGLDHLTTTLRDVPERHRSLRAVIDTSWQLLSEDEQALFRRLAVFRGGFTRSAAERVAGAHLPLLLALADRSFLQLDEDQRFRRHPLLYQFAWEQLAAHSVEQATMTAAHARFFATFVQSETGRLQRSEAVDALARLGAEWENIRASWGWGLAQEDTVVLDQLVAGMSTFLLERCRYAEGLSLFETSIAQIRETALYKQPIRAKIQLQLGNFLHEVGQFSTAETVLKQASGWAQQHGLTTTQIEALHSLGEVLQDLGERERARPYLEDALGLCTTASDDYGYQKLLVLNSLGKMGVYDGRYDEARQHFEEALRLANELGQTFRIASLHNNIAVIANSQQRYEDAIREYARARDGFIAQQHLRGMAATSLNIGIAYVALERYDAAIEEIEAAYDYYQKLDYKRGMVNVLSVLGTIHRKQGKRRQARRYYNQSLQLAQTVGVVWSALSTLVDVAELEMSYGRLERAALLLSFAANHPTTESTTLDNAQKLLSELQAEMGIEEVKGAETAAQSHTLDSIIDELVNR